MVKGISIALVTLSLVAGFQAHADIEKTLSTIDFKSICTGNGGSTELGQEVAQKAGTALGNIERELRTLQSGLNTKENRDKQGIAALIKNIGTDLKAFENMDPYGQFSQACHGQKNKV